MSADLSRGEPSGGSFSLARYLLARILLLVVPIVLAGMALQWYFERRLLVSQFDESLVEKAMTLATLVVQEGGRLELEFADEFMPQYSREERPYYFQVFHPDGTSIERSFSLHGEDLPFEHGPLAAPQAFEVTLASGVDVRCIGTEFPTRLGPGTEAPAAVSVVIVLGAPAAQLHEKLAQGYREVAITGAVSVAGIALFVLLALRRGSQLLRRVVTEVQAITPGTLQQPLDTARVPEEIRPIVASLNQAMQTIHGYLERERRFTADVAHELRTPIAELRVAADIAARWPDAETRDRLEQDARAIALQMGSLVDSLLELATLESGAAPGPLEELDLAALVARVVEQTERGTNGSQRLVLDAPARLTLPTRSQLWEVAVRNLLDNALSYSTPGAKIRVSLRSDLDGARFCVSNPTDSLDGEGALRCTERLWRGSRDPREQHFGLGLSIVQAACAKLDHRFSVRLEDGVFHATICKSAREPHPQHVTQKNTS